MQPNLPKKRQADEMNISQQSSTSNSGTSRLKQVLPQPNGYIYISDSDEDEIQIVNIKFPTGGPQYVVDLTGETTDEEKESISKPQAAKEKEKQILAAEHDCGVGEIAELDKEDNVRLIAEDARMHNWINLQTRKKLETLTASLALATSANKKQIAESFISFANEHNNRQYRYLCCVDVGSRNLAWITYDCEQNAVVQWSKLDIAEKVTVAKYHQRVQTLIHNHLLLPGSSPNDYKVYIERQFFASPSNKIIESLLFAAICNQASELNPRTLGSRKKQAVALVRQFVKENTLPFDKEDTAAVFEGSKKKDDLSDAYVMLKYMLNSIKVVKEWYEDFKSEKREKE